VLTLASSLINSTNIDASPVHVAQNRTSLPAPCATVHNLPNTVTMPSEASLSQIVKGAPTAAITPPSPAPLPLSHNPSTDKYEHPSSAPSIYLNLLILESSLRSQYLHLLSRRRLNTFFILALSLWNTFFFYALFLRPREDGLGLGGSVYWMIEVSEKLALMGGVVTALLVWGTGQWERGVRWPRRWLSMTNRGLRGFNLRVVIMRRRWYREWLGHLSFLFPFGLFWSEEGAGFSDWHLVEHENGIIVEEDLAKGGDYIMLLLLPKSFSPEFRENWEEYRSEYWTRENERRAVLRRKVKTQRRVKAMETGGWKWYTGLWRLNRRSHRKGNYPDPEKQASHNHQAHHHPHTHNSQHHARGGSRSTADKDPLNPLKHSNSRRRSLRRESSASHSRQSSRSSTPADLDGLAPEKGLPLGERVRRGSSVSSTASVRRKTRVSPLTATATGDGGGGGGGGSGAGNIVAGMEGRARRKRDDASRRPTTPDSDSGAGGEAFWSAAQSAQTRVKREDGAGGVA
jgi:hypothetical protein